MPEFAPITIANLCTDYDWQLKDPIKLDELEMEILYCPVRWQEKVSSISAVHAWGGIVAAQAGARLVYAMESRVVNAGWQKPMERWLGQAGIPADKVTFVALDAPTRSRTPETISNEAYPTNLWSIAQHFSNTLKNSTDVINFASALKITPPLGVGSTEPTVLADRFERSGGRLDTAFLTTRGLHRLLQTTEPSKITILSGRDEAPWMQQWKSTFAPDDDGPYHLSFPTVITTPPNQPLSWYCAEDLIRAFDIAAGATDPHDSNAYIPWLTRQVYLLGRTILQTREESDPIQDRHELALVVNDSDIRHKVARGISDILLQLPPVPAGQHPPRQA